MASGIQVRLSELEETCYAKSSILVCSEERTRLVCWFRRAETTFSNRRHRVQPHGAREKVRDRETRSPAPETDALPREPGHSSFYRCVVERGTFSACTGSLADSFTRRSGS